MEDLWALDLKVLAHLVEQIETHGQVAQSRTVAEQLNEEIEAVNSAMRRLIDHGYVQGSARLGGGSYTVHTIHERGLRATKAWPSDAEHLAALIISALAEAADKEQEPQKRGKLRAAASSVGAVGKDVLAEVLATVIARSTGIG